MRNKDYEILTFITIDFPLFTQKYTYYFAYNYYFAKNKCYKKLYIKKKIPHSLPIPINQSFIKY